MVESGERLNPEAIRFLRPIISSLIEKIIIKSSLFSVAKGFGGAFFKLKNNKEALTTGIIIEVEDHELIIMVALQTLLSENLIDKAEKLQETIMDEISKLTGSKVKEVRLYIRNFRRDSSISTE